MFYFFVSIQFRTIELEYEALNLNMKKQKILGAIIMNNLEIKNSEKIRNLLSTYYL